MIGSWEAEGISIDTRRIAPNEIFVAFRGNNVDGHDFISEVASKNHVFICERLPKSLIKNKNLKYWIVDDVVKAIEVMAKYNRSRSKAKFIGVTGSVGKTTVKEALTFLFSKFGKTFSSKGNYNNHLGVPISLASMPLDIEYAIFEMGMSALGEIDFLTKFVRPNIAIITHVAPVHIEFLKTIENIARAKSEIFNSMDKNGVAIINGDVEMIQIVRESIQKNNIYRVYSFGKKSKNNLQLTKYTQHVDRSSIEAQFLGKKLKFDLSIRGEHHAQNMLSVILAAHVLGVDTNKITKALKNFNSIAGRGQIESIVYNKMEIMLIDESYNSSPESLISALKVLGGICMNDKWKRKVAILSDMGELGEIAIKEHLRIAKYISENKIDFLITVGKLMKNLHNAVFKEVNCIHYDSNDDLRNNLDRLISDKDVVLVKGSNGTKIYEIVQLLKGK
ncbi:MAG: UDP-N-acetylmuramoyl-tripeptide--D-alanyl-D-alanine ligase [Rickettsiales bacterium]